MTDKAGAAARSAWTGTAWCLSWLRIALTKHQNRGGGMLQHSANLALRGQLKPVVSAGHLAAFVVASVALSACSKAPPEPPTPMTKPVQDATPSAAASAADTSVPAAAAVVLPADGIKLDPAAGRSNSAMSQAQESSAMPMPGQNNDHSAPQTPAKRASGP